VLTIQGGIVQRFLKAIAWAGAASGSDIDRFRARFVAAAFQSALMRENRSSPSAEQAWQAVSG